LLRSSEFSDLLAVRRKLNEVRSNREKWLSSLHEDDLEKDLRYRNLQGQFYAYPLWQQLAHVVNHSTYHRGQVTTMMRQLGTGGVSSDLLLYYDDLNERERSAGAQ
jgi:uncharacterized damage-inducible protein DinB